MSYDYLSTCCVMTVGSITLITPLLSLQCLFLARQNTYNFSFVISTDVYGTKLMNG